MNKTILASSIALAITTPLLFAADQSANNQSSNNKSTNDDQTLVVTANKFEQNINDTLANIEVISRQDIERIQPESITDLLTTVSGLDIVTQGGAGQSSSIFARGSNSDHTLVLINGVRVGSASNGTKALATISVSQIERIEIIRGPRASIWGSDAIGAVIQVFTRQYEQSSQSINARVGTNDFRSGSYSIGFGNEKLSNSMTISGESSNGFDVLDNSNESNNTPDSQPDNDGYRRISFSFVGDYILSDALNLNWTVGANQGNNEFDNNWGADETDYKDHFFNIQYVYNNGNWNSSLSYGQSRDYLTSYGNNTTKEDNSIYETRRQQANGLVGYQWNNGFSLSGGFDLVEDNLDGSVIVNFDGSRTKFDETERTMKGGFVYASYQKRAFTIETSARYDDIVDQDSDSSFSIAASYNPTENLELLLSRGKGFKAPTFNDLYYPNTGFFAGNENLVSEVSFSNELSVAYTKNNHSLSVVRYQTDFNNLIAFEQDESFVTRPFNIEQAFVNGFEINYRLKSGAFYHKLSATHINATQMGVDENDQPKKLKLIRRVEDQASYQFGVDVNQYSLFAQLRYVGERPDSDFSTGSIIMLDSYNQLNLSAQYFLSDSFNISLKINDALYESPVDVLNYQTPGRQIFIGSTLNF